MTPPGANCRPLAVRLVLIAVAIEFCVSAKLLTCLGIPYTTEGGAFPFKIHPGTYVLCLAFLVHCAAQSRPSKVISTALGRDKFLAVYLGSLLTCIVYASITTGRGNLIVLIDTFLPAGLLAAILDSSRERDVAALRRLFQWGVVFNAMLALGEAAAHEYLVPPYIDHGMHDDSFEEFRPTALYDHPLTGGVMTMIGFALPPRRSCLRIVYTMSLMSAMLAFGGRMSVAAVLISWLAMSCFSLGKLILQRDRRAVHLFIATICVLMTGSGLIVSAFYAGLGSRLAAHLYWDPSAQVRLVQWHLLDELNAVQLLFGVERSDFLNLLNPLWLTYGVGVIENFWLLMFVSLGLAGFSIFLMGFVSLLCWCWYRSGLRGRVLLIAVVVVASTSNSLGRKSTLLVGMVGGICCVSTSSSTRKDNVSMTGVRSLSPGALIGAT